MISPLWLGFKSVLYLNWTGVQIQTGHVDVDPIKIEVENLKLCFVNAFVSRNRC